VKGMGLLLVVVVLGIAALYYMQSGPPETGGTADAVGDVANNLGDRAGDVKAPDPEGVADSAEEGMAWLDGWIPWLVLLAATAGVIGLWRRMPGVLRGVLIAAGVAAFVVIFVK
jgi:hypothetical protein